jgi:two-component system response regulator YesN
MSPGAFQTWWRIERAKGLLKLPGMRIYEVADKIGFADAFTFSRSFKSIAGVSPSQWRRIHVR